MWRSRRPSFGSGLGLARHEAIEVYLVSVRVRARARTRVGVGVSAAIQLARYHPSGLGPARLGHEADRQERHRA
eukprot:scaffold5219_cov47-Phaeocystis_antarctica.AAC.3